MSASTFDPARLRQDALAIRKSLLKMHFTAQSGHIGTGLSSIELLTYLYRHWLRAPGKPEGDPFVLSKGHGASSLYATLHHMGLLGESELSSYYKDGTLLAAHPAPKAYKTIPAATGSLGHGLPIATGMAFAHRVLKQDGVRVAALLSDGECNEGTVWEACAFAAHHGLSNLTIVIDANGLQGFGRSDEVLKMDLVAQFRAFGLDVAEINGHDFDAIHAAFQKPRTAKPLCIVARTVKGKGVSYMENKLEWHYLPMKEEQYRQALSELEAVHAR